MSTDDGPTANGSTPDAPKPTPPMDPTGSFGDQPSRRHRHTEERPGVAGPHPADATRDAKLPPVATTAPDATPVRERFGPGSV